MADIRNDDLEDILAGMLDEQDRSCPAEARRRPPLLRFRRTKTPSWPRLSPLCGARRRNPVPSRSLPHPGIRPPRVPRVLPSRPMNLRSPHAVPPPHRPTRPRPAP